MTADFNHSVHDDVLAKMDALLKRHHDRLEKTSSTAPAMDFPVLTEVIQIEEEVIPVLTEVVEEKTEMNEFPFLLLEDGFEQQAVDMSGDEVAPELSRQLLEDLHLQIQEILDQRLPVHIASAMDRAMSTMLDQFSSQLKSVVHEAVAHELQKQLGEIARRPSDADD